MSTSTQSTTTPASSRTAGTSSTRLPANDRNKWVFDNATRASVAPSVTYAVSSNREQYLTNQ